MVWPSMPGFPMYGLGEEDSCRYIGWLGLQLSLWLWRTRSRIHFLLVPVFNIRYQNLHEVTKSGLITLLMTVVTAGK